MKILFSEFKSDYQHYIFPYAIWAIPETKESPGMIFDRGFLPSSLNFERFYMCRHVRVDLQKFEPSSENRRVLRKCSGIEYKLIPSSEFKFTDDWRDFCKNYADIKFGKDVMTYQRLQALFSSKLVTHLMVFKDVGDQKNVGIVTLYIEHDKLAYYYYSFYDLNYYARNLGMFIMTSAVDYFANLKKKHIYLGSCYSKNALYKTQFSGAEFFNGFRWSDNLKELKYLIKRDGGTISQHLAETEEFREKFYDNNLSNILNFDRFILPLD